MLVSFVPSCHPSSTLIIHSRPQSKRNRNQTAPILNHPFPIHKSLFPPNSSTLSTSPASLSSLASSSSAFVYRSNQSKFNTYLTTATSPSHHIIDTLFFTASIGALASSSSSSSFSFSPSNQYITSLTTTTTKRYSFHLSAASSTASAANASPDDEGTSSSVNSSHRLFPAQQVGDDPALDKKYRSWRIRTFYSIFLGYATFYFTRNSFTYSAPGMRAALGFSLEQLGIITSVFPIAYGFSKLIAGILCDKFSSRAFMALGLAVTGVINILFGFQTSLWAMCAIWMLNGVFQGFGAPPSAKLLTSWYSKSERGTWWGFWNTSHNTGGFFIPLLAGYCVRAFGWQFGMIVPGMIAILMGMFLYNRLRDDPESVGLPAVDYYRKEEGAPDKHPPPQPPKSQIQFHPQDQSKSQVQLLSQSTAQAQVHYQSQNKSQPQPISRSNAQAQTQAQAQPVKLSAKETFFKHVASNPYVWLLAVAYFFVYFVRQGVSSWAHIFLLDFKGVVNAQEAAFRVSGMELGGLLGSLASGWVSDRMLRGRRIPIIILWMIGVMLSIVALWFVPVQLRYLNWFAVFCIGFFIYGPQMLIGLAGAEIVDRSAVSSTIGLLGWIAYLGASIAGYPLTRIISTLGWPYYVAALLSFSAIAVLLLMPMWTVGMKPKPISAQEVQKAIKSHPNEQEVLFTQCRKCAGTGEIVRLECGSATATQLLSCRYIDTPCPWCNGTGHNLEMQGNLPMA